MWPSHLAVCALLTMNATMSIVHHFFLLPDWPSLSLFSEWLCNHRIENMPGADKSRH